MMKAINLFSIFFIIMILATSCQNEIEDKLINTNYSINPIYSMVELADSIGHWHNECLIDLVAEWDSTWNLVHYTDYFNIMEICDIYADSYTGELWVDSSVVQFTYNMLNSPDPIDSCINYFVTCKNLSHWDSIFCIEETKKMDTLNIKLSICFGYCKT